MHKLMIENGDCYDQQYENQGCKFCEMWKLNLREKWTSENVNEIACLVFSLADLIAPSVSL